MSSNPQQHERRHIGPEGYSDATELLPLDQLGGMEVRDASGEKIGKVDDSYTDTDGTYVRYLAVTTGWFGTKRHMIPVDDVRVETDGDDEYLAVPYEKTICRRRQPTNATKISPAEMRTPPTVTTAGRGTGTRSAPVRHPQHRRRRSPKPKPPTRSAKATTRTAWR